MTRIKYQVTGLSILVFDLCSRLFLIVAVSHQLDAQLAVHRCREMRTVDALSQVAASKNVFRSEKSRRVLHQQFALFLRGQLGAFIDDLCDSLVGNFCIQDGASGIFAVFHRDVAYDMFVAVLTFYFDFFFAAHEFICLDDFSLILYSLVFFDDFVQSHSDRSFFLIRDLRVFVHFRDFFDRLTCVQYLFCRISSQRCFLNRHQLFDLSPLLRNNAVAVFDLQPCYYLFTRFTVFDISKYLAV